MNKPTGMLTPEVLRGMVASGEIETVVAGFTDHYGRMMGKRFDAERAQQLGLVNIVTSDDYWLKEAMGLAHSIAAQPPVAARLSELLGKEVIPELDKVGVKTDVSVTGK